MKTFFYSLKRSLFDPSYYKDIVKATFGFSMKYLWLLVMIIMLLKTVVFGGLYLAARPVIAPAINKFINYANNFYPNDLKLEIANGQLSTNVKQPYIIDLDKKATNPLSRHFLVIDTHGSIDNYPFYNTYILATKNAVVYPSQNRGGAQESSVFYFSNLKNNFSVDKNIYDSSLNEIRPYLLKATFFADMIILAGMILFLTFGSFFLTLAIMIGLAFLTFIVWIFNKIFKAGFSYSTLYRLGMHAVTWPIIITEIVKFSRLPLPNLYVVIYFVWMVVVLNSFKGVTQKKIAARRTRTARNKK